MLCGLNISETYQNLKRWKLLTQLFKIRSCNVSSRNPFTVWKKICFKCHMAKKLMVWAAVHLFILSKWYSQNVKSTVLWWKLEASWALSSSKTLQNIAQDTPVLTPWALGSCLAALLSLWLSSTGYGTMWNMETSNGSFCVWLLSLSVFSGCVPFVICIRTLFPFLAE